MPTRNLLRKQLSNAWKNTIRESYNKRLINTEHGLHAHFYGFLRDQFKEESLLDHRHVYFEQTFVIEGRSIRPDLVVCNDQQIIAVVELKYAPRSQLEKLRNGVTKDVESLRAFSEQTKPCLDVVRHLGPNSESGIKKYSLAKNALLCWAGVYKSPYQPLPEFLKGTDLPDSFFALHAVTSHALAPELNGLTE